MLNKKLTDYTFPDDLKSMNDDELDILSYEIRDFLIQKVSKTGGHLASSLGAVELALSLHRFFNSPDDKIIWDVGHQAYPHKILTGRAELFDSLRQLNGLSGFPKKSESEHDVYDTGHSSSSLSYAAGLAASRDLKKENHRIAVVIGDGALTGGIAYEALNNIGDSKTDITIILNDNGMSISPNTGSLSKHLSGLRSSGKYLQLKNSVRKTVNEIPSFGETLYHKMSNVRDSVKYSVIGGGVFFEELGFQYYGPIDGHSIEEISNALRQTSKIKGPVIIHAITKKGKGYVNAEKHPDKFHGIGSFDIETGALKKVSDKPSYSKVFGNEMVKLAKDDEKIIAVSAAMLDGTGLLEFSKQYPDRTFDVGIAEEHAVTFAAGLAGGGLKPVVAIYSTFLQRAYDQIMEDVCLQKLPVVFAIDRGGIVGADGETHHGIFDLSYLGHMPGMNILVPADGEELKKMLFYALELKEPVAVRYPRGEAAEHIPSKIDNGINRSAVIKTGSDVEIWAVGEMLKTALDVCDSLNDMDIDAGVVNARTVKPLDKEALLRSAERTDNIITLEDNVLSGGFGMRAASFLEESGCDVKIANFGWPEEFIKHGSCVELKEEYGLSSDKLTERICDLIEKKA